MILKNKIIAGAVILIVVSMCSIVPISAAMSGQCSRLEAICIVSEADFKGLGGRKGQCLQQGVGGSSSNLKCFPLFGDTAPVTGQVTNEHKAYQW